MAKKPIDYFAESEKYKPIPVEWLLVAEAPPPSGTKYFYMPRPMSNEIPIEGDRSLPATIFHHFFWKRPESKDEYAQLLDRLKAKGIFLMDIVDKPIRIRGKSGIIEENMRCLIKTIPMLRKRIKARGINVPDDRIIFLLARKNYKKHLKEEFPISRLVPWIKFRLSHEEPLG